MKLSVIKYYIIGLALILTNVISAQDFQGVATYKSQTKIDVKMDSTQVNSAMQEQMMEMLKKQMQKTYKLTFNKEASIYKEEESLAPPQPSGAGFSISFSESGTGELYKNTKENRFTNQNESFSKLFLIKDELKKLDWKLGSETKNIGEYTCYKATMTREQEVFTSMSFSSNDDDEVEEEEEPEMKTITITAWYTPQIPINTGPGNYYGLPGLILEVNDGNTTLICSKIVLNPKEKKEIKEPTKGKEISQEKYDEVMEKKSKEMMERFKSNRRGRGDGETISISIGG